MFNRYSQILGIVESIREVVEYLGSQEVKEQETEMLGEDISLAMGEVNRSLFLSTNLKEYNVKEICGNLGEENNMVKISEWCLFVEGIIEELDSRPNEIHIEFQNVVNSVRYVDKETILDSVKMRLLSQPKELITGYNNYYKGYSHLWGTLDTDNGIFDVVEDRVNQLVEHLEDFIDLFDKLGDNRSRLVLLKYLQSWLTYDIKHIYEMYENNFGDYFDFDLIPSADDAVFVDFGAFDGDSIKQFIGAYRKYKKIYGFEITKSTFELLTKNLEEYDDIVLINKGAGSKKEIKYVKEDGSASMATDEVLEGASQIEITTLDDEIKEPVSFIKMDIEGAEKDALLGCRRHVIEEKPKLLICVYHNNEDMWKIPQMISEMRDDYTFYLRSNGRQYGPAEIVLFAL